MHVIRRCSALLVPAALVVLVVLVVLVTTLASVVPAGAEPHEDKSRVDRELEQVSGHLEAATGRAREAADSYANAVAALPAAESAFAEAQGRVAAAEAAIRRAQREADAARAEQAVAGGHFTAAVARVDEARESVSRFAAATYKGGDLQLLGSLVDAGSPAEFATRLGYLDKVAENREKATRLLTGARAEAFEKRADATAAHRRAEDAAAAAERALANSRAAAAAAADAKERVRRLAAQRQAALDAANSERAAVLATYNDLKAESSRIEAELRAAAARRRNTGGGAPAAAPVSPSSGAFLMMPTRGSKSSGFGRRFHPLFRVWIHHSGLDIGAGTGTPIVAAGDGEVINAGWRGGYGEYTCIDHGHHQGRAVATCYGHQSQILVRGGQHVRRGQLIGRVGSTGNSTGPHLHFEVRLSGTPVDPEGWLPRCLC